MQPVPTNLSADDVHGWLSGCYFYASNPETYESCVSTLLGSAGNYAIQNIQTGATRPLTNLSGLYCHWPIGGAINLVRAKYAIYAERIPRKQWKRTFCPSCYTLRRLGASAPYGLSGPNKHNHSIIAAIFEPAYFTYTEAKQTLFPSGWESVALTPQLTIVPGDIFKVYFQRELVGKVTRDNTLFVTDRSLRRQLLPHFDGLVG